MEFEPRISPDCTTMPEEIFYPAWGKLKQLIERKKGKQISDRGLAVKQDQTERYTFDFGRINEDSAEKVTV